MDPSLQPRKFRKRQKQIPADLKNTGKHRVRNANLSLRASMTRRKKSGRSRRRTHLHTRRLRSFDRGKPSPYKRMAERKVRDEKEYKYA